MVAVGQMPLVADVLLLERRDEFLVALEQEVGLANADPEQLQYRAGTCGVVQHAGDGLA